VIPGCSRKPGCSALSAQSRQTLPLTPPEQLRLSRAWAAGLGCPTGTFRARGTGRYGRGMSTWIVREGSGGGAGPRVAVKDIIDMAGLPTTAACRALAERAEPAVADAPCLAGLRAAMGRGEARFVGKTNLHELAFGISGVNAAFVRCPRFPGQGVQ
jgi:Amidase